MPTHRKESFKRLFLATTSSSIDAMLSTRIFICLLILPGGPLTQMRTVLSIHIFGSSAQIDLANITAINLIENGDREARERWQNRQLTNLLSTRKPFQFLATANAISHGQPRYHEYLPIQSREDVATQFKLDGPLAAGDGKTLSSYASTGSTGTPVKVYICPENGYYNSIRSLAQYFFYDLSLDENCVHIVPASVWPAGERFIAGRLTNSWAGPLGAVFRNGSGKIIVHRYNDDALIKELLKDPVGYLSVQIAIWTF